MVPQNRVERNNAFLGFLLFFFITIGIVVTVVYFSTKTTVTENEQLRRKILGLEARKEYADSFKVALDVALNEMQQYTKKDLSPTMTHADVRMKIKKMANVISKMPEEEFGKERSLYQLVMQTVADLNDAKSRIRDLESK